MGRVNAFLKAGNDHREISVGGRSASDRVWARLNTDNCEQTDCCLYVSADVEGPGLRSAERRKKSVGDHRTSHFYIELPEPSEACEVRIETAGGKMRELAYMGLLLCGVKAAQHAVNGEVAVAEKILEVTREIVDDLENRMNDVPNVLLPGGVTLRRALACVQIVERLVNGEGENSN